MGSNLSATVAKALRRSFVPVAYAHWEGFVKKCADYYLEFVAMQGLRFHELSYPMMSIHLWKQYAAVLERKKPFSLAELCQAVLERSGDRVWVQWKDALPRTANLNSNTLREICRTLGVPFKNFETKTLFIDFALLERRNHIAHGEFQDIDEDELESIKNEVVMLIDMFRNELENAAVTETFRKA